MERNTISSQEQQPKFCNHGLIAGFLLVFESLMHFSIGKQKVLFSMSNTLWKAPWGSEITSTPLLLWGLGRKQLAENTAWLCEHR